MDYKKVILKRGKEESLGRFHPWIFSGAIAKLDDGIEEGDIVSVYTSTGAFAAVGHYQIGSIAVRILSFDEQEIGSAFFAERLRRAFELRKTAGLLRPDNNAFRLVHGEGDFLPGLVVDVYGHTAIMQAHSPGMHFARNLIAKSLVEFEAGWIRNVYYKSETTLPYKAHLDPQNDYIIGQYEDNKAMENGLSFYVDWLKGQKTGFFIDQRDNRSLLEHYAKGRTVLNMFCYTGGFSVYALRGGAKAVHSVDSSEKAIRLTEANVALNYPDDTRHRAFVDDAFHFLDEMEQEYDLIVLDPPAFAKHKSKLRKADCCLLFLVRRQSAANSSACRCLAQRPNQDGVFEFCTN